MSAYLKRLEVGSVEEVEVETTNTAYLKQVHVVEIVDEAGRPWEPSPDPDPFDELVVGDPTITGLPFVGETITCSEPTVSGGIAPYTYTYAWKVGGQPGASNEASAIWAIGAQVVIPPQVAGLSGYCDVTVVDDVGQIVTVSSNTLGPIEYREFGDITVTINDIEYDHTVAPALSILMNDPMPVVVSITGDATPTYLWEGRANYPVMVSSQTASTVLTFPEEGMATVTCTITDSSTEEFNTSVIINFLVVDAL